MDAHAAVAVYGFAQATVDAVLADWRSAEITPQLHALCELSELLTLRPAELSPAHFARALALGLDKLAIAEALRACWVFSVVNRTVDAMGGRHPSAELQARASKVLYALGMPWLNRFRGAPANGSPARARPVPTSLRQDVFTLRAEAALAHVTSTEGVTTPALRAEVSRFVRGQCGLGDPVKLSNPLLEPYLRKVTLNAYKVTDDDIGALTSAGLSEGA